MTRVNLIFKDAGWIVAELFLGTLICSIPAALVGEVSDTTVRIGLVLTATVLVPAEVIRHMGPNRVRQVLQDLTISSLQSLESSENEGGVARVPDTYRYGKERSQSVADRGVERPR
ncbi:MAG: hypothetical protein LAO55_02680 [Acidobacteriia bacterium]|nr:hypothetical protein [Terriglobia bacterium]